MFAFSLIHPNYYDTNTTTTNTMDSKFNGVRVFVKFLRL